MATNVPDALYGIYKLIDPYFRTNKIGGVAPRTARSSGYHNSPKQLRAAGLTGDYSIQCPADRRGNDNDSAGIDITFDDVKELITMCQRLRAACTPDVSGNYDPRIEPLREFIGTIDGRYVCGYNRVATGTGSRSRVGFVTSGYGDSTHLWHGHLSILRDRVNNHNDMTGIAEVLVGAPRGKLGWKDAAQPAPPGPTYTVKAGDTLTKIAATHGLTSWQALAALNSGIDPNNIRVGQVINVPEKPATPEPEPPVRIVVVSTNMQDATMKSSQNHPWGPRKAGYISAVKSHGPDVILVQEATKAQLADLGNALGFNWWRSEDTTKATDPTPDQGPLGVLWNPAVLERTGDGREKELYSNRRVLRVPLKHTASGKEFDAVVSHLDNGAGVANIRDRQASEIAEWLPGDPKPTEDSPLVFGWDANDRRRTSGPRKILNGVGVKWIRDLVSVPGAEYESHHGYGALSKGVEWIDDLGVRGMRVIRAGVVRTDRAAPVKAHRNVTDHNILWAEVELKGNTNV